MYDAPQAQRRDDVRAVRIEPGLERGEESREQKVVLVRYVMFLETTDAVRAGDKGLAEGLGIQGRAVKPGRAAPLEEGEALRVVQRCLGESGGG